VQFPDPQENDMVPALLALVAGAMLAAVPPPGALGDSACSAPPYRQFDFWLGNWRIEQEIRTADGGSARFAAADQVEAAASGCAVVEHWHGVVQFYWEGMTSPDSLWALSVRSYDAARDVWSIYWLDSRHATFGPPFVGRFDGVRGTFTRRSVRPDGTLSLSRIVFDPVNADSVEWRLDVSRGDGTPWTTIWRMHFHRATGSGARNR
jgi:hypothetical protein